MLWPWDGHCPQSRYCYESREIPEHLVDKGMKTLWLEFDHGKDWNVLRSIKDSVESVLLMQMYKKYVKVSWKP